MSDFWADKRELFLSAAGAVIFAILLLAVIFSFRFLVKEIRAVLNPNLIKTPEAVKFNLDLISSEVRE